MNLTLINYISSLTPLVVCIFQVSGCYSFQNIYCFRLFQCKSLYISIIYLAIKYVKVILGSFERTMMGWSPQCFIKSFMEIGPPVVEIFEGFLPYMEEAATFVI